MKARTYLIWSNEHSAWWRPRWNGYTMDRTEAGIYSEEEAAKVLETTTRGLKASDTATPDESLIPYAEWMGEK